MTQLSESGSGWGARGDDGREVGEHGREGVGLAPSMRCEGQGRVLQFHDRDARAPSVVRRLQCVRRCLQVEETFLCVHACVYLCVCECKIACVCKHVYM